MQSKRKIRIYAAAPLAMLFALPLLAAPNSGKYLMYVGTYTRGESKGIYAYRFNAATGETESLGLAAEVVNPSFLALHPNGKFLYAVNELGVDGKQNGGVTAFSIDPATAKLTKLNNVSSGGGGACHLVVDKTGKSLMVANYGTGSVGIIPVKEDGSLGEPTIDQHKGSSVNKARQQGPHAHAVVLSADNRFLFVPDLGLDEIFSYRLDAAKPALTPNDPPFVKETPGSGPRHFAFHPGGKYAYAVNEMKSSVTAFQYDKAAGSLKEIQNISTLPKNFSGEDNSAEIEVDPAGKFLYASNRGHDSIAVFSIGKDGQLTSVQDVPTQGKAPRNFKIDPSGKYLFAANQDTGNIVVFKRDVKTGQLTPNGKTLQTPFPVCLQFVPVK